MANRRGKSAANLRTAQNDITGVDLNTLSETELKRLLRKYDTALKEARNELDTLNRMTVMTPRGKSKSPPKTMGGAPPPPPPITSKFKKQAEAMKTKIAETKGGGMDAVLAEMSEGRVDLTKIDTKAPLIEEGKRILKEINGLLGYQEEPHEIDFENLEIDKIKEKLDRLQQELAIKKQLANLKHTEREGINKERRELARTVNEAQVLKTKLFGAIKEKFKNVNWDDEKSSDEEDDEFTKPIQGTSTRRGSGGDGRTKRSKAQRPRGRRSSRRKSKKRSSAKRRSKSLKKRKRSRKMRRRKSSKKRKSRKRKSRKMKRRKSRKRSTKRKRSRKMKRRRTV